MRIDIKRIYDEPSPEDGYRVLVDRLWPRGLSKEAAALDRWAKEVAPSPELRKAWHAASDAEWGMFAARYRAELAGQTAEALAALAEDLQAHDVVTLLYSLHDPEHNPAVVLAEVLREHT